MIEQVGVEQLGLEKDLQLHECWRRLKTEPLFKWCTDLQPNRVFNLLCCFLCSWVRGVIAMAMIGRIRQRPNVGALQSSSR